MASLTSNPSLEDWLTTRRIKLDYKAALTSLGVEEPQDFMDLDDEDIEEFVTTNDLNKIQKKRFIKAYREIKYGESAGSFSSPRVSRSSSIQSRSSSLTDVLGETKDSDNDGTLIVNQYR